MKIAYLKDSNILKVLTSRSDIRKKSNEYFRIGIYHNDFNILFMSTFISRFP